MARIFFIAFMLTTWAAAANGRRYVELESPSPSPSPSPSSSPECSTLIYNMASCTPFLSDGGSETKPDSSCCSGFESVVEANAECICEAVRSSSNLGTKLNMTKTMTLFSACGVVSAPPINNCTIPPPPPGSPPASQPPTPSPSNPSAPVPSSSGGETPAPSADNSGNQAPVPSSSGGDTPAPSTDDGTGNQAPAPSSGGDTPAPSTDDDTSNQGPAPSPQSHGGAYATSASLIAVIISMLVASVSIISV